RAARRARRVEDSSRRRPEPSVAEGSRPTLRLRRVKVLSVVGNRPQLVKSGALSVALRAAGIDEVVVHTGQHYDRELSEVFVEELELPEPRYRLDLHTADPEQMKPGIAQALLRERPRLSLV